MGEGCEVGGRLLTGVPGTVPVFLAALNGRSLTHLLHAKMSGLWTNAQLEIVPYRLTQQVLAFEKTWRVEGKRAQCQGSGGRHL